MSRKNNSVFSSGQLTKLIKLFEDHGVGIAGVHHGFAKGIFADVANALGQKDLPKVDRNLLRRGMSLDPLTFSMALDCSASIEQLAERSCISNPRDLKPAQHNLVTGITIKEFEVQLLPLGFRFNYQSSPDEWAFTMKTALRYEVGRKGLQFGSTLHLVAFADIYQHLKCKDPVVALDTIDQTRPGKVACLDFNPSSSNHKKVRIWFPALSTALRTEREYRVLLIREVK